jgi:hypothetical protein
MNAIRVVLSLVTEHAVDELAKRLARGRGIRTKGGDGDEWLGCGQIRSVDLAPVEGAAEPQIAVAPAPEPSQRRAPDAFEPPPAPRRSSKPRRKAKRRTRR